MKRLYVLLVLAMIIGPIAPVAAQESTGEVLTLTAPDGATVEIDRDDYGVPHISADTEVGVFFGQGFAVAQDRLFQLEQYRRAALGRIAELVPTPEFLEADMRVRTLYYTEDERQAQFDALSADIQTMLEAYVDGINVYLDSIAVNPSKFQPVEFILLGTPEPWTATHSVAVMQFFMRGFGQFGGQELERLGELQLNGQAWIDENRPLNDPTVPTTIPGAGTATTRTLSAYTPPPVSPEVIRAFTERRRRAEEAYERLRIPKLGSFAVLTTSAKSATGNVLLLGAPQMGQPAENAVSIVNEVELISPTLHMGGMSVAGIPSVVIGRNEHFAWTLTSGFSDNTDTFRETVQVQDGVPTAYLHNGEFMPFEAREETVFQGSTPHPMTVLRTIHGPVVAMDLANEQVFTHQMTFWNKELDLLTAFYDIGKATNLAGFEAALAASPLNFNVFYADMEQNIKFFHIGKLLRSIQTQEGPDPRFPREGDGSEEWGDDPFLAFEELPQAANPAQGYFVNWNNKPIASWNHGDNIPWTVVSASTEGETRGIRVGVIDDFVGPIASFTFDNLREVYGVVRGEDSYPGAYQQILEFMPEKIVGENLVPPGQSGFVGLGGSSPHLADQWSFYQSVTLKPFLFSTEGGPPPTAVQVGEDVPEAFALHQNYPNPFNPSTTIVFDLSQPGDFTLKVYDVLGREVAVLASGAFPAGRFKAVWDATGFASGVYVYRLQAETYAETKTLILQK